ncbi:MAG: energy-coupling factor ABC transporter permease [Phycisphaeraceae bacterium]|nr:energy-coupling factor ABC transporter permease [Phycisphaeraceae bacterium]
MHLGNGTVTPACALVGMGAAALGLGVGYALARKSGAPQPWRYAAGTAMVFAAQMCNVTILPGQSSGHIIGGFLLAYWFGSFWGLLGMSLLLGVQSLLFADGGWMALGLNILNMGVLPCLVAYPLWKKWAGSLTGAARDVSIFAFSWASVVLAALVCSLELLSVPSSRGQAMHLMVVMLGVHALIALVEASATVAMIRLVPMMTKWSWPVRALAGVGFVLGLIAVGDGLASPWPDGLEYTLSLLGLAEHASAWAERLMAWQAHVAVWPDYSALYGSILGCLILALAAMAVAAGAGKRARNEE